jgi:hypothetical protein
MSSATPTSFAGVSLYMAPGTESGYKGVTKNGKNGWQARAGTKDARCYLGTFSSKVEAAVAFALDAMDKGKEDADPHTGFRSPTTISHGVPCALTHGCLWLLSHPWTDNVALWPCRAPQDQRSRLRSCRV